jgi:sugar phosphate isomerase/epimerase
LKAEERQREDTLKGQFPFRLGTTSYIIPDDLVPNVTFLADKIDDVELVLFESDEISNLPDQDVIETLIALAEACDLTYTVHLPLDIDLGSREATARRRSVEKCRRVIYLTEPLQPFAYLLHLPGRRNGRDPADDLTSWTTALEESIRQLLDNGPAPETFCAETLAYPYEHVWDLVQRHGLSVCLDIGHILLSGYDLAAYLDIYLPRCRVVHLHGIREGKDHRDIGGLAHHDLTRILGDLQATATQQERVLTLEVFDRRDFDRSLNVLRNWL